MNHFPSAEGSGHLGPVDRGRGKSALSVTECARRISIQLFSGRCAPSRHRTGLSTTELGEKTGDRRRGSEGWLRSGGCKKAGRTGWCAPRGNGVSRPVIQVKIARSQRSKFGIIITTFEGVVRDQIMRGQSEHFGREPEKVGITVEACWPGLHHRITNKMDLIVNDSTNQVEMS